MTSLIIVSHSEKIAEGTKELLGQMSPDVDVVAIGGADGEIGTSFDAISDVLAQLENDAMCFFDIGSAEMNLDMAIEMYAGQYRIEKVSAPIVEGSFLASVSLTTNGDFDQAIEAVKEEFDK
ncbi:PTS-dependent dihydroxyacetone kinase phosphotransferase subunit DhaM [Staphylococcus hyicus]|uniref:Dihydroxyacetone kinase phosphoryl donor subunit DhaM n=1 Tax=Staphylococcus hyicus TaxID=1284 RepID=A0ACD5FQ65_STAHY|nr:dihydroxyacetone kinase phosphoryl donor subunit DhaM [Staphylococcus hyicus]AJC95156.1 dihydroxyacetone kinase, phosphotransfer subunit [Staphylococcus hyicus]MCE5153715.1 PTS-dependent dihydroxyacetone kinase phosphotransferase subunit DhaM [Staphylococcus hyicus]MDP4463708.1 dihydroxyacetone kinase phosphoryl donor subunit DhaM [Staphylococcus hyicus]RTX69701.1 PTS-dependent dihydroxyacetone kinase phosphotransferase subunit DhaM [Staphylococcus hyicus]UWF57134.1 dihydroxyacetone kinase 